MVERMERALELPVKSSSTPRVSNSRILCDDMLAWTIMELYSGDNLHPALQVGSTL